MESLVNIQFRDDSKYAGDYLSVKQSIPLNAEPSSPGDLTEHWITPDNMFYQRNHGPIQHFDYDTFELVIRVDEATAERVSGLEKMEMKLGLKALEEQGWPKKEVAAALQCAGNRRDEMSERGGKTEGLGWGNAVLANGRWAGYLLRPLVLSLLRLPPETGPIDLPKILHGTHVEFVSDQPCVDDEKYAGSVTLLELVRQDLPIMLAVGLNGQPLSPERGGPIRIIAPGHIGARSVKWVERIIVQQHESDNFYQQRDYKVLAPYIRTPEAKELALPDYPALQNFGLTSVITSPSPDATVSLDSQGRFKVSGYALGCKGVAIAKVELCVVETVEGEGPDEDRKRAQAVPDKEWVQAALRYEDKEDPAENGKPPLKWAWYLFRGLVKPLPEAKKMTVVSRATDAKGCCQPCMVEWNIRGVEERSWSLARNIVVS